MNAKTNNRMVYISASIIEKFDKEPNKSGLVNELLKKHYEGSGETT